MIIICISLRNGLKLFVLCCNKMSRQFLKMSALMTVHIWKENHYWQYELSKGCVSMTVYIDIPMFGSFPSGIPFQINEYERIRITTSIMIQKVFTINQKFLIFLKYIYIQATYIRKIIFAFGLTEKNHQWRKKFTKGLTFKITKRFQSVAVHI